MCTYVCKCLHVFPCIHTYGDTCIPMLQYVEKSCSVMEAKADREVKREIENTG